MSNLPSGWHSKRILEVALCNPRSPSHYSSMDPDTPVTFIPMAAVSEHTGEIEAAQTRTLSEVRRGFTHFTTGDVLFAKITPCMQNGKSVVVRNAQNDIGFGSTEFHVLRAGSEVLPDWLHLFVRQQSFRLEAAQHFRGSAGQQRVPIDFIAQHEIPLPPIQEQRRIIQIVQSCLQKILEAAQLRNESRRCAAQMEGAVFADAALQTTEHGYSSAFLNDVITISQYGISKRADSNVTGTPILRMGNIQNGHFDYSSLKYIELTQQEKSKYLLDQGDILVNRTNSLELVGKAAVFNNSEKHEFVFASYLIRLKTATDKALPNYVAGVINSRIGRDYIHKHARRAIGMVNINARELGKMPIPLPPLPKQQEIMEQVTEARMCSERLLNELDVSAIESLSSSVLKSAFAGEL
ncbi:restriction endonuclease subunit S [Candidatus Obscuribacterales bacterium]|nr:restriction endonuclease subunit S [Candidatus Obscuribacterales bacterium]